MAKALVISRYFPPLGSAGASIRLIKLMKFAAQAGWDFVVLTEDPDYPALAHERTSSTMADEIPPGTDVVRIPHPLNQYPLLHRFLHPLIGYSTLAWGLWVVWKYWRQVKKHDFDLVFANSPPFTNAIVGAILSRIASRPLVFDLKDDFVGSPTFVQRNPLQRFVGTQLERFIIRFASAVIIVSPPSYEMYLKRYSYLDTPEKFQLIPNGYDGDEFKSLESYGREIVSERFTILTAAAGYWKDYRDLTPLLLAIENFIKKSPEVGQDIDIVFLGKYPAAEYIDHLDALGINHSVEGSLSRQAYIKWLWKADLLFIVQPRHNRTAISGTLYEYWATGKAPVLLISEEGAASKILNENKLGKHFLFDEVDNISSYIEASYRAYHENKPVWIERGAVENYSRQNLASKMLEVWAKTLGSGNENN